MTAKSAQDYADDYYDNNDYGLDNEKSGVLFLVSKGDRKYHISTKGAGIKAFTDYGIGRIKEEIKPYLSDGDYFDACDEFLNITKILSRHIKTEHHTIPTILTMRRLIMSYLKS